MEEKKPTKSAPVLRETDGHKARRFGKFMACSTGEYKTAKPIKKPGQRNRNEMPQMRRIFARRPRRNRDEENKKRADVYGCSRYPKCDYASWKNPMEKNPEMEV